MPGAVPITTTEKQAALDAVLASDLFTRSAQLRKFLAYVCQHAIDGRADEISEYAIGIEALGRPAGYSIAEDSAVRSRAYELRQRLTRFYSTEGAECPVRILMPKGSYVPAFVRREDADAQEEPSAAHRWKWIAAGAAVLALASLATLGVVLARQSAHPVVGNDALTEAWGPLARSDADVIVDVATKLHLLVRPHLPHQSAEPRFPVFPQLYEVFQRHRPLAAGTPLMMETADSSVAFGEVSAIAVATNTLSRFGASYALMPERLAPLAALRNRNAVVIGIPMDSLLVTKLLSNTIFTVEYHPAIDELAIIDRRQKDAAPRWGAVSKDRGQVNIVYGLVTVLPSEGNAAYQKRTVIFSGLGSVGTNGAADFFSSAEHMRALRGEFRKRGLRGFPPAYQVVVRCNFSEGLLLSTECVTSEVLNR